MWTIPAERSKNGEEHKVPLSDMALEIIADARRTAINGKLINRSPDAIAQALNYALRHDKLPVSDWDIQRTIYAARSALTSP